MILQGVAHTPGTAPINITTSGVYDIQFYAYFQNRSQIEIRVNGGAVPNNSSRFGTNSGNALINGHIITALTGGDVITVVLTFSTGPSAPLTVFPGGGGAPQAVNASVTIKRID